MSAAEQSMVKFEIQDHNIAAGYVTYIVDIWEGDKTDPATDVVRYIGVWRDDQLEKDDGEAFDPDFTMSGSRRRYDPEPTPEPISWTQIDKPKKADGQAKRFRQEAFSMEDVEAYAGWSMKATKELYIKFLDAIDVLATNYEDEKAWEAVHAYQSHQALKHEK